ncbi:MAG: copper amine oxidase N-terminal domain-containing protein, partial [Clostridiales bacterium]|nr:copper amine oxidase N-terminal domain-containing protein [Clostridiales bacterium]
IELKTTSAVTKLVNGRLNDAYVNRGLDNDSAASYVSSATAFNKDHKTADISFSENVTASWWALRESEFTLPDGVKFMQVKITDEDNLDHTHNNYDLDGEYPLSNTKVDYVQLNANRLRITDVEIQRDETAFFKMQTWVSVESGWEGDIMLGVTGNDLLEEVAPVKIATAVSPITVKTSVTDVKIGYQWQKVADVTVTETDKGMLPKDKEVVLTLDDEITGSDRIAFAPDFVTEINTDSNMTISKPSVEEGLLKFVIERASNNKPASIKFSNMYVKIDRTVPESNKQPYKVVVGGTAVAANYYGNVEDVSTIKSFHPLFSVKGIGADYLNVITSATNSSSLFSNVVRVTIGSNEVVIGRDSASQTLQMDTAAYISTTNSTMVPVRFVSQAFGLSDESVLWDPEARTVTILGGPNGTVQLKIGSDQITIGGATTTMYSPDVPPVKVAAEIKDNRSFLPFRQLGNALGVPVEWDEATNTAIYNAQLLETAAADATDEVAE